jgi:hypothetical protein
VRQAQKAVVNKKKKKNLDDSDDDEGSLAQKEKMKADALKVKAMQDKIKKK